MIRKMATASLCAAIATVGLIGARPVEARQATAAQEARTAAPAAVNLNTASVTDLEKLPGVGPATAQRIVEYRQKNGGFKKIEDLMNVRGIGEASFLKLKPQITVAPVRTAER